MLPPMIRRRLRLSLLVTGALLAAAQVHATAGVPTPSEQAHELMQRPALDNPTTISITPTKTSWTLPTDRDYVISISSLPFTRGIIVEGGRNVVLEDATVSYRRPLGSQPGWRVRGIYFKGQSRTMWVKGLTIRGPLLEGIDLDQRHPGSRVVLQDISIAPIHGTQDGHHADLLQTWAGPDKLVVNGFTGTSDFQGFFLKPNDTYDGPPPTMMWLQDVDLDVSQGYYALWATAGHTWPIEVDNVSVVYNRERASRNLWLWPKPTTGDETWDAVVGK